LEEGTDLKRILTVGFLGALLVVGSGCEEKLPTITEAEFIPVSAHSVEVLLTFDEFAKNLRIVGGYGTAAELGTSVLARAYEGTLESRTLAQFWPFPFTASVRDTTGATRPDSTLTFVGGRVVVFFDTLASVHDGPVDLAAWSIQTPWHPLTATWDYAVDTVGDKRFWPQAGVGPVTPAGTGVWDPTAGDSLLADSAIIEVDSATVVAWGDTTNISRGLRLDALTDDVRLKVTKVLLHLDTRPSSNPDTIIDLVTSARYLSFAYDPFPEPPETGALCSRRVPPRADTRNGQLGVPRPAHRSALTGFPADGHAQGGCPAGFGSLPASQITPGDHPSESVRDQPPPGALLRRGRG
jgi:hypothetical protein